MLALARSRAPRGLVDAQRARKVVGAERDRVKKEGRRALLKLRASLTKLFRHLLQLHASPEVRRALQSGAAAKARAAATAGAPPAAREAHPPRT